MIEVTGNKYRLTGNGYSYCFYEEQGKLLHSYYGKDVGRYVCNCEEIALPRRCNEFSEFGRGDFRIPSVMVCGNQTMTTDFRVIKSEILSAKPKIGMPQLRGEFQTLAITLRDDLLSLKLTLYYTPYGEALVKSAMLENEGACSLRLHKLSSGCFDFPCGKYDTVDLSGRPNKERDINREKVVSGIKTISSTRGITSHQHSSFLALSEENATEEKGNVYGFNLVYSGNFAIECEKDEFGQVRVVAGENLLHGGIELAAGERFFTPEVVSVYSSEGFGEMSRIFHRLYRKYLLPPRFADTVRPIVINSWESVVYNFGEKTLFEFIDGAKGLGIDMVVLDDGWFGKRDNDDCSLGDWVVDKHKLPNGLTAIIDKCRESGMKFGLWFEPEMISPISDLYRNHPDWVMQTDGRKGVQFRNQWVLDFTRKDVVDYVYGAMEKILCENRIEYVKWDMNRALTDVPNARKYHDYVLGVYSLYERLTERFPYLLIEGCASGGGRFDVGILYYSPMIWTSDNTDAWSRARIQYATSLCYPLQTMSNHVSACPNIQTTRNISFRTRGAVAMLGCLGYELHVANISEAEREEVRKQTEEYKKDAHLILTGNLYRLKNPFIDGVFAEEVVSDNQSEAIVVYIQEQGEPSMGGALPKLRLKGLRSNSLYFIKEIGETRLGEELMVCGVEIKPQRGDYSSVILHLKEA